MIEKKLDESTSLMCHSTRAEHADKAVLVVTDAAGYHAFDAVNGTWARHLDLLSHSLAKEYLVYILVAPGQGKSLLGNQSLCFKNTVRAIKIAIEVIKKEHRLLSGVIAMGVGSQAAAEALSRAESTAGTPLVLYNAPADPEWSKGTNMDRFSLQYRNVFFRASDLYTDPTASAILPKYQGPVFQAVCGNNGYPEESQMSLVEICKGSIKGFEFAEYHQLGAVPFAGLEETQKLVARTLSFFETHEMQYSFSFEGFEGSREASMVAWFFMPYVLPSGGNTFAEKDMKILAVQVVGMLSEKMHLLQTIHGIECRFSKEYRSHPGKPHRCSVSFVGSSVKIGIIGTEGYPIAGCEVHTMPA